MTDNRKEYISKIDLFLEKSLSNVNAPDSLINAMRYSLLNAGKRVRPVLALEFARLCSGNYESVIPAACAVEYIHTYSLIHDDLPCMDDDDFRRGKPSCHKAFDEATALLAGDALLTMAFELIADADNILPANKARAISVLSKNSGMCGMIGGQVIDIESEGKEPTLDNMIRMFSGKTCALIQAACTIGCIAAGGSEEQISAADTYGYELGMAFQIIDDVLDTVGDFEKVGKPIGSDAEKQKANSVSLLGIDGAVSLAREHTRKACESLSCFDDAEFLIKFAKDLETRIA